MGIRSFNQGESYFDRFARTRDGGSGTGGSTPVSATGGTKFTSGDYTYHFYVNDAFAPQPASNKQFTLSSGSQINVLVIGGGAGGQNDGGGGGGAGGVAHAENMPVSPGTFVATVGRGRAYADSPNTPESSTFEDPSGPITITGNGGGLGRDSAQGNSGGSGGGGGNGSSGGPATQPGANPGLSYVTNYGNAGGPNPSSNDVGAGGGGAGGVGGDGGGPPNGIGGDGQPFTFMPGPQLYTDMPSPLQSTLGTGWRDALGPTGLMAGGGGGGADGSTPYGGGGPGGGGNGGQSASAGVNYTGSGGGGGPSGPNQPGASGGNGLIVVYYPT